MDRIDTSHGPVHGFVIALPWAVVAWLVIAIVILVIV